MTFRTTPVWKSVAKSVTPPLIWDTVCYLKHNVTSRLERPSPLGENLEQAILGRIRAYTSRFKSDNSERFCSVIEDWLTRNRWSKFIINTVRTHELFGHQWRLPLWDNELIQWWYRIPLTFRMNSVLYHRFLFERLFDPLDVGFRKPKSRRLLAPLAMRWLPAAMMPWLRLWQKRIVERFGPKPLDIDGFDDVSSILLKELAPARHAGDFGNVNGVVAEWCLCHNL